jgi:hypothetical protein
VRLKITRRLSGSIDGVQLSRFQPGTLYDVATSVGTYLLAIGAAESFIREAETDVDAAEVVPPRHQSITDLPASVASDRPTRKR